MCSITRRGAHPNQRTPKPHRKVKPLKAGQITGNVPSHPAVQAWVTKVEGRHGFLPFGSNTPLDPGRSGTPPAGEPECGPKPRRQSMLTIDWRGNPSTSHRVVHLVCHAQVQTWGMSTPVRSRPAAGKNGKPVGPTGDKLGPQWEQTTSPTDSDGKRAGTRMGTTWHRTGYPMPLGQIHPEAPDSFRKTPRGRT
jgi:hypothetical protein